MQLILTVQSLNNGQYRFHISENDFNQIVPKLQGEQIYINLPGSDEDIEVAHNVFFNHQNLYSIEISNWIILNDYINWEYGNPFKLVFSLNNNIFNYYNNQAH